jgi:pimeloyl-ACP methyl ester carboxylesterase
MKKKQTKWILWMCGLLISMAAVATQANAQVYADETGAYQIVEPYMVDTNDDEVDDSYIFRPEFEVGDESHPIIVFCVGTDSHPYNREGYRAMLNNFASHGIVIIAGTSGNQVAGDGDQALGALDWIVAQNQKTGEFYHKLNTNRIVSMGHSQGGAASIHVALRAPQEIGVTVTAIAALMSGTGEVHGGSPITYSNIDVPIFYVGAEKDWVVWPYLIVLPQYIKTTNAPAWFGVHLDSGHSEVPDTLLTTLKAWLYAQLYDDSSAREVFYGQDWTFENDSAWKTQRRKN